MHRGGNDPFGTCQRIGGIDGNEVATRQLECTDPLLPHLADALGIGGGQQRAHLVGIDGGIVLFCMDHFGILSGNPDDTTPTATAACITFATQGIETGGYRNIALACQRVFLFKQGSDIGSKRLALRRIGCL